MKIKWRVAPVPTGRYRAFDKRGWPSGMYQDESAAAQIRCADEYRPRDVKAGNHAPLTLYIADYSKPSNPTNNCGFTWRRVKASFPTLPEAKAAAQRIIANNPGIRPKEYRS